MNTSQLLLVPTQMERKLLLDSLSDLDRERVVPSLAVCGFGLVAAAARTSFLLAELKPQNVVLLGIAGRLSEGLEIGSAYSFGSVVCHGIGAGSGADYQSAEQLGWPQWAGLQTDHVDSVGSIGDRLKLQDSTSQLNLLSCTAASGNKEEVKHKLNSVPNAVAEDMEGYAVAMACAFSNSKLRIIRGISNDAGDREHSRWQIAAAMASVAELVKQYLEV